jgi:hypothetical protein
MDGKNGNNKSMAQREGDEHLHELVFSVSHRNLAAKKPCLGSHGAPPA